jgi:hypothetical protein
MTSDQHDTERFEDLPAASLSDLQVRLTGWAASTLSVVAEIDRERNPERAAQLWEIARMCRQVALTF